MLLVIGSSLSLIATTSNSILFPGGQIGITQETKAKTEIQNTSTIANKTLGNPFYEESKERNKSS